MPTIKNPSSFFRRSKHLLLLCVFFWGGGRGGTNETPGTDHVIWGPMRGLEKNCTQRRTPTDGHGDSMTEMAQWGRFSENHKLLSSWPDPGYKTVKYLIVGRTPVKKMLTIVAPFFGNYKTLFVLQKWQNCSAVGWTVVNKSQNS